MLIFWSSESIPAKFMAILALLHQKMEKNTPIPARKYQPTTFFHDNLQKFLDDLLVKL